MTVKVVSLLIAVLLSMSLLAGCESTSTEQNGGDTQKEKTEPSENDQGAEEPQKGEVNITETEFKISPSNLQFKKGETAVLKIENAGNFPHVYKIEGLEKEVNLQPGENKELEVTFDQPGTYKVLCTVDAHADKGMVGEIVVE